MVPARHVTARRGRRDSCNAGAKAGIGAARAQHTPGAGFPATNGVRRGTLGSALVIAGLASSLEPRPPSAKWTTMLSGTVGFPAHAPASGPPSIARVDGWDRASATASGPLLTDAVGNARLGGFFGASWTRGRDIFRAEP